MYTTIYLSFAKILFVDYSLSFQKYIKNYLFCLKRLILMEYLDYVLDIKMFLPHFVLVGVEISEKTTSDV